MKIFLSSVSNAAVLLSIIRSYVKAAWRWIVLEPCRWIWPGRYILWYLVTYLKEYFSAIYQWAVVLVRGWSLQIQDNVLVVKSKYFTLETSLENATIRSYNLFSEVFICLVIPQKFRIWMGLYARSVAVGIKFSAKMWCCLHLLYRLVHRMLRCHHSVIHQFNKCLCTCLQARCRPVFHQIPTLEEISILKWRYPLAWTSISTTFNKCSQHNHS